MEQSAKVNTILNCFVDLNLETNERFLYDVQMLNVSFASAYYSVTEANSVDITLSLNEPSHAGIEEADIILSHTSTTPADLNVNGFPIHIKWEIGEQEKTITVPAARDFIEEGDEEFRIGITNLVNLMAGSIVQTNVVVIDATVLRSVSILAANTNNDTNPREDPNAFAFTSGFDPREVTESLRFTPSITANIFQNDAFRNMITFTVMEGEQINITVGLDSPSQYGVEKIDLTLTSAMSGSDFDPISSTSLSSARLEWSIGDQFKTVTISASLNNLLDGTRSMILALQNPDSVKIDLSATQRVKILIKDPSVARRFTTVDLGRIFKQRGSVLSGVDPSHTENELYLRSIPDNQTTTTSSLYWMVELGTIYADEQNTPSLSESANYSDWPYYYFGVNATGDPQDVYLRVTNQGVGEIEYNGVTFGPNQSFNLTLAREATTIVLPTNDGLLANGSILVQENIILSADTFTQSKYKLEIVAYIPQLNIIGSEGTSGPHGFRLKTLDTSPFVYLIGDFDMVSYSTVALARSHRLGLMSSYANMRTRFDMITCSNTFEGSNRVHNVRIHGLILLSENSLTSDYISHELADASEFEPICGSSSGMAGNLPWVSIPFEIL